MSPALPLPWPLFQPKPCSSMPGALRLGADVGIGGGAVGLAEGVAAGDEGHRLLVVHGHALEGLADEPGRQLRVRVAVGPLGVHVDQAHVVGAERSLQLALGVVTLIVEPLLLGAPVGLVGLPHVGAPEGETEGSEPHRLEGAVAGEDHQVGPREVAAVLLLHRPQEPARLVQVAVVGPAVEGGEALVAGAAAAAAVADAVGAGGVPGHADEEGPVVAVVGRPPVLRGRHNRFDVLLQGLDVEALHRLGVVEVLVHGVGQGGVVPESLQAQLVRPPVLVGPHSVPPVKCSVMDGFSAAAGPSGWEE